MTAMSDYLETTLLNHVFRNVPYTPPTTIYLALFTAAPTDAGGGTELTGGSYARQAVSFSAPVAGAGTIANSASITFTNLPSTTIVAGAVFDALTGGNMLMHGALTANRTVAAGDNLTVALGDFVLTFS